jgi:hypothetical protein
VGGKQLLNILLGAWVVFVIKHLGLFNVLSDLLAVVILYENSITHIFVRNCVWLNDLVLHLEILGRKLLTAI